MSPGVGPSKEKFVGALFVCLYREDFSVGLLNIWMLVIVLQMESLMWCKCSKFKQDFFFFNFLKNCEIQVSWTAWQLKWKCQLQPKCQLQQIWDRNQFHLTAVCEFWIMIFLIYTISFNHFSIYDHYISLVIITTPREEGCYLNNKMLS